MDESHSAAKQLGLDEASEGTTVEPVEEGEDSDTESEAEGTTMTVMGEANIDIGAESLPNSDDAHSTFAGKFPLQQTNNLAWFQDVS